MFIDGRGVPRRVSHPKILHFWWKELEKENLKSQPFGGDTRLNLSIFGGFGGVEWMLNGGDDFFFGQLFV